MKAEERHELKENELVRWLIGLPQWARENTKTIVLVGGIIAAIIIGYGWYYYERNVAYVSRRLDLSERVNQLYSAKQQAAREGSIGKDMSFALMQAADRLGQFAADTQDKGMAALAYIKRGEALRASLHYRPQQLTSEQIAPQIELARESYNRALELASGDPTLTALARYGLGLCAEELEQYDVAADLYTKIIQDANLDGTVGQASARFRLSTFEDYKGKVVFRRLSPAKADANAVLTPADTNTPLPSQSSGDVNAAR